METIPSNIETLIKDLPVISFEDSEEFQKVIVSPQFNEIFNFYKENYLPDILKDKPEIYQRVSLYLTLTNQNEKFVENTDQVLYRRPVPTIEEFLESNRFLGLQNASMFPYWKDKLCEIFAPNSGINRVLWSGATGTGKALYNNSIIPTPNGNKLVSEIKQDDLLWGKNGKPTKVLGVYPQGDLDLYKITFDDDTSVICSGNHIWHILKNKRFGIKEQDITTEQMLNSGISKICTGEAKPRYKYKLPTINSVEYSVKEYEIPPYVLGCMLGDGYFSKTCILSAKSYPEIVSRCQELLKDKYILSNYDNKHYGIIKKEKEIKSFSQCIKDLGLYETRSYTKFIPNIYKIGSIEQRYELLKGLLDTDGTIQKKNNRKVSSVLYGTVSLTLANDVCELVRSLGGRAKISKTNRIDKKNKKEYIQYIVLISVLENPFFVKKKRDLYYNKKIYPKVIHAIEKLDTKGQCTCFEVDSDDHLFLCNDYIPTHNTVTARKAIIYCLYRLLCLRYPRAVLNVELSSTLAIFILSVTQKTAYQTNFEPFIKILSNMPCFQRVRNMTAFDNFDIDNPACPFPWFVDKSNMTIVFKDNIILTLGSQISNTVGYDIVITGADEVNELGVQEGMELLNSIDGRIQGRFASSPYIFANVMSSARSTNSVTKEYVKKWITDPGFLYLHPMRFQVKQSAEFTAGEEFIVQVGNGTISSKIIVDPGVLLQIEKNIYEPPAGCEIVKVPGLYKQQFEADIEQSIQDILGIDTKDTKNVFRDTTLLEDPSLLPEIQLEVNIKDNVDILACLEQYDLFERTLKGNWQFKRAPTAERYVHVDLSGSGQNGQCDTGLCICHKEYVLNENTKQKEVIYVIDLQLFINAKNKVDLHAIQQFLIDLVVDKNINIHTVSFDQWQSMLITQNLSKSGCFKEVKQLSVDAKLEPYTNAALLIESGKVKVGPCAKLKRELEALIFDKNKVTRTVELKDGCDALVGAIYNAQFNYFDIPQYEYKTKESINVPFTYESLIDSNKEELFDLI